MTKKNITLLISIIIAFLLGLMVKTLIQKRKFKSMTEISKPIKEVDEQLIRKIESDYDSAWHQGNIENLMACFIDDATLISPRGDHAFGKAQIRKLFTDFLGQEAKGTKHTGRIIRITFVSKDVALVDGEAFIEGKEKLSHEVAHHKFIDVLVRTDKGWRISQIRAFAID